MVQIEKCLICNGVACPKYKPFCSIRCKDIDLGKWLNENYRVQTEEKLQVIDSSRMRVAKGDEF